MPKDFFDIGNIGFGPEPKRSKKKQNDIFSFPDTDMGFSGKGDVGLDFGFGGKNLFGQKSNDIFNIDLNIDISPINPSYSKPRLLDRTLTIPTANSPITSTITSEDFKMNMLEGLDQGFSFGSIESLPGTGIKNWSPENVAQIDNRPGLYKFYNRNHTLIYVGVSYVLKHRLQSYYQKDDFNEHPTKRALRNEIAYFEAKYMSIDQAREMEHRLKQNTKHNHG